jgi:hypothetical protein
VRLRIPAQRIPAGHSMNTRDRDPDRHTDWCARDHRCAIRLGEHRADPITLTVPSAGSAVITRVRTAAGTEHAEVRLTVDLASDEQTARQQLAALLTHVRTLIGPPRVTARDTRRPTGRAA